MAKSTTKSKGKAAAKPKAAKKAGKPKLTAAQDKALDRDNKDGAGGSLPKAERKAAKAERKAARKAERATIRIERGNYRNLKCRFGVNGKIRELPTGEEVEVTAAELAALEASHVAFETLSPLAGEGAVEGSSAPSTEQPEAPEGKAGEGPQESGETTATTGEGESAEQA